jgi:predicted 3-demethylubiquinone-9 3-methyltransferase (glyoxalase superfamily)
MSNQLYACLWFNGKIKEATAFYCSLFPNHKVVATNDIITKFELEGTTLKLLNGGTLFSINPSISLFVKCETKDEIEKLWLALSNGGKVMMPLGTYPWCEQYAWVADQYGMTWQLFLGPMAPGEQKIIPSLLFTKEVFGKGVEAMQFYTKIFSEGKITSQSLYEEGEGQPVGSLKFGSFSLNQIQFAAMDGPGEHSFSFNEGVSFVVECKDQAEVDYYWNALTEGGHEGQCGWLKDKFGLSWQIIPVVLNELMRNPETAEKAKSAFMKMRKFIIQDLY